MFQNLKILSLLFVALLFCTPALSAAGQDDNGKDKDRILKSTSKLYKEGHPASWDLFSHLKNGATISHCGLKPGVIWVIDWAHKCEEEEFSHHQRSGLLGYRIWMAEDQEARARREFLWKKLIWIEWSDECESVDW